MIREGLGGQERRRCVTTERGFERVSIGIANRAHRKSAGETDDVIHRPIFLVDSLGEGFDRWLIREIDLVIRDCAGLVAMFFGLGSLGFGDVGADDSGPLVNEFIRHVWTHVASRTGDEHRRVLQFHYST